MQLEIWSGDMHKTEETEILKEALRDAHDLLADVRDSILMSIDGADVHPIRYELLISINNLLDGDKKWL